MGPLELLAILVIALLVVGPEELPKVARKVALFIGEIRRHGEDVRTQVRDLIDDAVSEEDLKSTVDSIEKVRSSLTLGSTSATDEDPGRDRSATRMPRPSPGNDPGALTSSSTADEASNVTKLPSAQDERTSE